MRFNVVGRVCVPASSAVSSSSSSSSLSLATHRPSVRWLTVLWWLCMCVHAFIRRPCCCLPAPPLQTTGTWTSRSKETPVYETFVEQNTRKTKSAC